MVKILSEAEAAKRKKGVHKSKINVKNKLMLTLEYRKYRTYFHIAHDFDVHETSAIRISRWVEEMLIKAGTFCLPFL
jgi:hypothetical protein